jgi:hypothetical protein
MHPVPYPAPYAPVAVTSPTRCLRPGCPCDSWDGQYGNYCSTTCHQGTACTARAHAFVAPGSAANVVPSVPPPPPIPTIGTVSQCARAGCPCDSWDGQHGNHCCTICHNGTACATRAHIFILPPPPCLRAGCPCDSWNGQRGNHCCTACHNGVACATKLHTYVAPTPPPPNVPCVRQGCPCDSWDGQQGNHCCMACHNGTACTQRQHSFDSSSVAKCQRAGCLCDSWNGHAGEYCSKGCRGGQTCPLRRHTFSGVVTPATAASLPTPQPTSQASSPVQGQSPAVTTSAAAAAASTTSHQTTSTATTTTPASRCAHLGCPCDSWNGINGEHCCKSCRSGQPCLQRNHIFSSAVAVTARPTAVGSAPTWHAAQTPSPATVTTAVVANASLRASLPAVSAVGAAVASSCARLGCVCDSWNGHAGEYCSKGCKASQACVSRRHPYTGPLPPPPPPPLNAAPWMPYAAHPYGPTAGALHNPVSAAPAGAGIPHRCANCPASPNHGYALCSTCYAAHKATKPSTVAASPYSPHSRAPNPASNPSGHLGQSPLSVRPLAVPGPLPASSGLRRPSSAAQAGLNYPTSAVHSGRPGLMNSPHRSGYPPTTGHTQSVSSRCASCRSPCVTGQSLCNACVGTTALAAGTVTHPATFGPTNHHSHNATYPPAPAYPGQPLPASSRCINCRSMSVIAGQARCVACARAAQSPFAQAPTQYSQLCANCGAAPPNPGYLLCQDCYSTAATTRKPTTRAPSTKCKACRVAPTSRGYQLCITCYKKEGCPTAGNVGLTIGLHHLDPMDPERIDIEQQFGKAWTQSLGPSVKDVFALVLPHTVMQAYTAYRDNVGRQTNGSANERRLYHAAPLNCNFYATRVPCTNTGCDTCMICSGASGPRFTGNGVCGTGFYFDKQSDRAHQYNAESEQAVDGKTLRCVLVCRVTCGKEEVLASPAQSLTQPSPGFHSLRARFRGYDEFVVHDSAACVASYLIVYFA